MLLTRYALFWRFLHRNTGTTYQLMKTSPCKRVPRAAYRLTTFDKNGMNKLAEAEKTSAFLRFLSQYNDPLNYLRWAPPWSPSPLIPTIQGMLFSSSSSDGQCFLGFGRKSSRTPWTTETNVHLELCGYTVTMSEVPTSELVPCGSS